MTYLDSKKGGEKVDTERNTRFADAAVETAT